MSKQKPIVPTQEERERMVASVIGMIEKRWQAAATDEERLMLKLDRVTATVRPIIQIELDKWAHLRDRKEVLNAVAQAYFENLTSFDKEELVHILSALLAQKQLEHVF
jgi:predicted DsbA family dithiol-disulfide isomerase